MCDPVSLAVASVAITGASTLAAAEGQRHAANQQRDGIIDNANTQDAAMQVQQSQVNEQSSQQMSARALEAMQQRGRMFAAFESGGNSAARIMNASDVAVGADMATLEANRANTIAQGQRQKDALSRGAIHQISALQYPSMLNAVLRIAGSATNAYASTATPAAKSRAPTSNGIYYDSTPGSGP